MPLRCDPYTTAPSELSTDRVTIFHCFLRNYATIVYCSLLATRMLNLYGGEVGVRSGQTLISNRGSCQRFADSGWAGPKKSDPWTTMYDTVETRNCCFVSISAFVLLHRWRKRVGDVVMMVI